MSIMNDPGRSPSPASSTTPHITQQQSIQEKPSSSTHQQTHLKSDATRTPRLPRIPPMTSDHPRTMTLQELWDWQSAWHDKRRHPTTSEIDDWIECGRQLDDAISDTTMDWEEEEKNEEIMDTCPSPTQRDHPAWTPAYQARRDARKQPPSPPPTPPRLKGPRLYRQGHASLRSERRGFRIEKTKCESSGKVAPRRPITRTFGTQIVSLHHQRGKIKFWPTPWEYLILDYAKYLRDWDREDLDQYPPEPMDFSHEDPKRPHKTDYQREVCRRSGEQRKDMKNVIWMPLHSLRGHK